MPIRFLFLMFALVLWNVGCVEADDDDTAGDDDVADDDDTVVDDDSADDDDDTEGCLDGATDAGPAGTTWVSVCGGTFDMGSDAGAEDERPVHAVTVPDLEMLVSEVTVAQFDECIASGPCTEPTVLTDLCNHYDEGYDDHPANCVDWHQAEAFCDWIGGRLPSESEWEYAARSGGQDITYPWGDGDATCDLAVMRGDASLGDGCGVGRTWPVCSMPDGDSDQGLCDMAGNVWEWVQDRYHGCYDCSVCPDYECDTSTTAPDDGSAWEEPEEANRVIRGGSYNRETGDLRAAVRNLGLPQTGGSTTGFRCAR